MDIYKQICLVYIMFQKWIFAAMLEYLLFRVLAFLLFYSTLWTLAIMSTNTNPDYSLPTTVYRYLHRCKLNLSKTTDNQFLWKNKVHRQTLLL